MEALPMLQEPQLLQKIALLTAARNRQGAELTPAERISHFNDLVQSGTMQTLVPALPLLFNLKGKPYHLDDHAPFEELFRLEMPNAAVFKTGRQVAKTTDMASSGIVRAVTLPNTTSLYVTPLFEQIRRFSANYVGPFIKQSPVKRLWTGTDTINSVLHRSFYNNSQMIFSFALLDADRIRGVSADILSIDETQDMNREHLPIIRETLSHSDWSLRFFYGTPKTLDNTLESLWGESSQAEWFVPCLHCTTDGHPTWNIPSMEFHIDKMIGPWHPDISEFNPATICYKCGQPISPRLGRWRHRYPERRWMQAGYHIPQIIMPLHYARADKWAELLAKQQGRGNTTTGMFYNEVLGESYDTAAKLITKTELMQAAILGPNTVQDARGVLSHYKTRILGVDWGGGGEQGISFTVAALIGLRYDGRIDVLWGKRLLTPHDHIREAQEIKEYWNIFKPQALAHDYTGAGNLRETFLTQAGVPISSLFPAMYVRSAKSAPVYHVAPSRMHPRSHYRVDKARTLQMTCAMIRLNQINFFEYDYKTDEDPGLIHDFLALTEHKVTTMAAGEVYRIDRAEGFTDDFAQAVNIACSCAWYNYGWPNLPELSSLKITAEQMAAAAPEEPDWGVDDGDESEMY